MKRTREKGIALITALLILLLITSLIAGFSWLVLTDQSMGGDTSQRQKAFYGAEAGMEQLTSALNNLFAQNYAPTNLQINALVAPGTDPATNPATSATLQGISFVDPTVGTVGSGYNIAFTSANGKTPDASTHQITAGPYQGLTGLITPYTLNIITQSTGGGEVKLQRTVQTVGIPLFEFGIFSQTDLSFFAGPNFSFGGRVHTNGNLYLAEGPGNTLTLGDKVTAVGEVIRTNLSNGWNTNVNYTGTVDVLTAPGSFRALQTTEGSLTGTLGSGNNPNWQNISIGTYHSYMRDGDLFPPQYNGANSTGAVALNLTVATPAIGGTPIDLIRRPILNEDTINPPKLGERYFAGASLRILLSDQQSDITLLPCVSPGAPIDLSTLARPLASWPGGTKAAISAAEPGGIGAAALLPLAASGGGASYNTANGYWVPANTPIISGYIKIEAATAYGTPCASYTDVTAEVLGLGYTGRNIDPITATLAPTLPALPGAALAPSACQEPHPNAIIRIQRVRDNPANGASGGCGVNTGTSVYPTNVYDFWPNALFDPREGNPRDWCPTAGVGGGTCKIQPTLGGVMYYVELDVANLVKWFTGTIGRSGAATKDVNTAPNDFSVYFSDRRGNFIAAPLASGWPPASPSGNETGEFGFNDWVNPNSGQGCPNGAVDIGEDFDSPQDTTSQNYGALVFQGPYATTPGAYVNNSLIGLMTGYNSVSTAAVPPASGNGSALQPSWQCGIPPGLANRIWPGYYVRTTNEVRENPALFFRHALKLVNGSVINLGVCPNGVNCGLTIASENPVYVQGNYNCGSVGCGGFAAPYGAAAVLADTFTFLSNNWNDINSFTSTYDAGNGTSFRNAATTFYRVAVAAGKGISFPQPAGTGQDFGTDGGVHNFLRYIENWSNGSGLNYRGSIISLYYNRQGTGVYKCCTTVYNPPTRGYLFDTDFLTPALLPPRTPMFRTVNTIGFTEYILPSIQ